MPDHFLFLECALKVSADSSRCLLTLEDSLYQCFPCIRKKTRLELRMCLNNNGVQKVNFFFVSSFFFLTLVEKFPSPCFCCINFFVIFIKAVLFCLSCEWIYSSVGCVLLNGFFVFVCLFFLFSWLYKKRFHVPPLTSIWFLFEKEYIVNPFASPFHQSLLCLHREPSSWLFFLTTFNSSIFTYDMEVSLRILK